MLEGNKLSGLYKDLVKWIENVALKLNGGWYEDNCSGIIDLISEHISLITNFVLTMFAILSDRSCRNMSI